MKAALLTSLSALALSACAAGPSYVAPVTPPSAAAPFITANAATVTTPADQNWWRLYRDPALDALVARGMKFTQWVSAASICTPSRAAIQTGRYPPRTGCTGNVERYRVVPTPSNPHGLDPATEMSLATALKPAGYATGYSGKWHLGINGNTAGNAQDHRFTPNAHGYDTYLGAPWTNAPMCAMDSDGVADKYHTSQTFCFLAANDTVVQQPLRVENFTRALHVE